MPCAGQVDFDKFVQRVGTNLRRARWAAGLSQEQLAAEALTFRLLAELERGKGNPTLRTLFALTRKLDLTISQLVDVEPSPAGRTHLLERAPRPPKRGPKARPRRVARKQS